MSYAVDVNVLLYATDTSSPYHKPARQFMNDCVKGDELLCLAWITVMGYLRVATHPSVFQRPLTPSEAQANIEGLLRLPHVRVLSECEGFWTVYTELTSQMPTRGNLVPDAHLAAILRQHGIKRLYTHDRDYLKFGFLDVHDPLEYKGRDSST